MRSIVDASTDPYFNIAAEEFLLTNTSEPIFRLWQNRSSIIVGRNQNTLAEINTEYIRKNNIPVVRRMSGGGAVFHDLGNINFTFIEDKRLGEDANAMFKRFTAPIIEALQELGVEAYLEGRNDLLIDGRKFSGNAIYSHQNRILQHGCILFSSNIADLSAALNTRPEKFAGKSVKSNISRVTNIFEHLSDNVKSEINSPKAFIDYLCKRMGTHESVGYSEDEILQINNLKQEKYITEEWNYGKSPKFQFSNNLKLESGFYEIHLNIESGQIADCSIQGDYFFLKPTSDIESALIGAQYSYDNIRTVIGKFNLNDYFSINTQEDFEKLVSIFI